MGFLLAEPVSRLGSDASVLEDAVTELPWANALGGVPSIVGKLKGFDIECLSSDAEQARAFAILSFLAHSHVWSTPDGCNEIPVELAVPWHRLALLRGLPPVLSYAPYVLDNRRPVLEGPAIAPALSFTGSPDEAWFIHVHQLIESAGAPIVDLVASAPRSRLDEEGYRLDAMTMVATCLDAMVRAAQTMQQGCDPYIYFTRVRKYLYGWKWNPLFSGRRMDYSGVDMSTLFLGGQYSGESGSQSPLLPLIDAFLGVTHSGAFLQYSTEMRGYMYPAHRDLIGRAGELGATDWAQSSGALLAKYIDALEALRSFRGVHLKFVREYIVNQTSRSEADSVGTGGSEAVVVLTNARSSVERLLASLS